MSTSALLHSPTRAVTTDTRPELRVLQVFHTLGMGGAEVWLIEILRHLRQVEADLPFRVRFDICVTGGVPDVHDEEAARLGARLHYMLYGRRTLPAFARQFRALLRQGRYHAIHDHQEHVAGARLLLGTGVLPPTRAVHFHNPVFMRQAYTSSWHRSLAAQLGYALVRRMATHVLGTSRQTLREHGVDRHRVPARTYADSLHCGFEVRRFGGDAAAARSRVAAEFGLRGDEKLVIFVGRLDSNADRRLNQKNPFFAVDVALAATAADAAVRVLIVGGGDAVREELTRQVAAAGMANRIHLLGVRTDVPQIMLAADLLLFPSLAEGLGMVAVEAQAAGLRVLASDAVPDEAAVVPGLVTFLPLSAGVESWTAELTRLASLPRQDVAACNDLVGRSRFSISRSVLDLLWVYSEQVDFAADWRAAYTAAHVEQ